MSDSLYSRMPGTANLTPPKEDSRYVVLGATGHVGSAVLCRLIGAGVPVTAVAHTETHQEELRCTGAEVAILDLRDVPALNELFRRSTHAFLLNPPGDVTRDADASEFESACAIIAALKDSKLQRVVAASTQGARPGPAIGDFGTLYELEQGVRASGLPATITRGAYYFSNWDAQLENAHRGFIQSFFPENFVLPMVAPEDLGFFNADRLLWPSNEAFEIADLSGPRDYSPRDVADAFAQALDREVDVEVIPRDKWIESFRGMGFSEASARSYARMTELVLDGQVERSTNTYRGDIPLEQYIQRLVRREHGVRLNLDHRIRALKDASGTLRV